MRKSMRRLIGLVLAFMIIVSTITVAAVTLDLTSSGSGTVTVYYCHKGTLPSSYTLKANGCQSKGENKWDQQTMTDTGTKYQGYKVYTAKLTEIYGGFDELQFQQYEGSTWKDQVPAFDTWHTKDKFDGKMYYDGQWLDYPGSGSIPEVTTPQQPAGTPKAYYFSLGNNTKWAEGNARFAIYAFESSSLDPKWYSLTKDSNSGYYTANVDSSYTKVIFVRLDPSKTENTWDNKWDQTDNLTPGANNLYTFTSNEWAPTGVWSVYTPQAQTETSATQPSSKPDVPENVDAVKAGAFASEDKMFWVDTQPEKEGSKIGLVKVYKGSTYRLYLPACADLTNLTFYHSAKSLVINGTIIENGGSYNVTNWSGKTGTIDGVSFTLKIMQSTARALYLETTKDMPTTTTSVDYNQYKNDCNFKGSYLAVEPDGKAINKDTVLKKIKGRGNSSWEASCTRFGKYAYNISLDKKCNLASETATSSKKWSMLANNADESMMRNIVTYNLSDAIGLEDSPMSAVYDVYNNGKYLGSYQMSEKVEVGSNALVQGVNVDDLNEEANTVVTQDPATGEDVEKVTYDFDNPTRGSSSGNLNENKTAGYYKYCTGFTNPTNYKEGNYLLEFELDERFADEISGFISNQGQQVVLKSPEIASKAEVEYVMDRFNAAEAVAYAQAGNKTGTHTYARGTLTISEGKYTYQSNLTSYKVTVDSYADLMDAESFSKNYLIQEFTENLDGVATSYYVNIANEDSKLVAKPVWDFDWTLGQYAGYKQFTDGSNRYPKNTDQWFIKDKGIYIKDSRSTKDNIVASLCKISSFWNQVKTDWNTTVYSEIKKLLGSNGLIKGEYTNMLSASVAMNEDRYHFIANDPISDWGSANTGSTWSSAVTYLESWASARATWMNNQLKTSSSEDTTQPAGTKAYYFSLGNNTKWAEASARFAIYAFESSKLDPKWYSLTKDSKSGYYTANVDSSYTKVIFVRLDPSKTENTWDNKWDQTDNLTPGANNLYTFTSNEWAPTGTWSTYTPQVVTETQPQPKMVTIKFVDDDGTEISSATYEVGATIKVPANPVKKGDAQYSYTFAGWDKVVSTTATKDETYVATYTRTVNKYTVTVTAQNGKVTGAPAGAVEYGTEVTLVATANDGYTFEGYYVNDENVSSSATYKFTVKGNTNVTVKFTKDAEPPTPKYYTVTATAENGTVTGCPDGAVKEGTEVTLVAKGDSGY
ncbi:MAG: CotH kinase family protein, partial [Oscillospiraceae bacterium]|nr:CotH kinase family protein [Oscillospiraceae bacterium]